MRNGDFSAVRQRHLRSADRRRQRRRPRRRSPNNQIPQDRISPIARRLLAFIPEPNIAGAPLGQNNYQKAQTREKTTDGFDAKVNYTLSEQGSAVVPRSASCVRSCSIPGLFGEYGGPANGGFAGTGTNTSYSTAGTWTRVFSANDRARRPRRR